MTDSERTLANLLLYVVFPLWLLAGLGDYLCHRASLIERTSGFRESLLHALQAALLALALLTALFFETSTLTLAFIALGLMTHTGAALWDLYYTAPRRVISPIEQHVHSYLEILPLAAFLMFIALDAHRMTVPLAWTLDLRDPPLPQRVMGSVLGLTLLVQGLPLLEECWRTMRTRSGPKHIPSERLAGDPS